MRDLRRLALLAPVLLVVPVACEDSSSSGGTFTPEAGPGFEAGPTPEAGPLPDGALPDTFVPPSGVTVTVIEGGAPKKDVRVIFHDATGAVTSQAVTDATGKVSIATAPSMVTVLTKRFVTDPAAVTFAGVTDGDNLRVVSPTNTGTVGSYDVTFLAGDPLVINANFFSVQAASNGGYACGGLVNAIGATASVALNADCVSTKNAILATASNPAGALLGFSFKKDVPPPVGMATVPYTLPAFTVPGATTVTATDLPVGTIATSLVAIANGQGRTLPSGTGVLDGGGVVFPTPTGFADAYQTVISADSGFVSRTLVRREPTTAPASVTLANFAGTTNLPVVSNATVVVTDPARPEITVLTASPAALALADGGFLNISWFVPALDSNVNWTFVVPPNTTSFKVPALPADVGDFTPSSNSFQVDDVLFFEASQLPNYQAAKALPVTPGDGPDVVTPSYPLPSDGTLRISRVKPFPP